MLDLANLRPYSTKFVAPKVQNHTASLTPLLELWLTADKPLKFFLLFYCGCKVPGTRTLMTDSVQCDSFLGGKLSDSDGEIHLIVIIPYLLRKLWCCWKWNHALVLDNSKVERLWFIMRCHLVRDKISTPQSSAPQ